MMAAAIVIAAFIVALVVTYAAVSRRLGPDPDLDTVHVDPPNTEPAR